MDRLTIMIRVLQQLQRLLPTSASLADVADLLACIEANYGSDVLLENVIQRLVGEHIAVQLAVRTSRHAHQVRVGGGGMKQKTAYPVAPPDASSIRSISPSCLSASRRWLDDSHLF